MQVEDVGGCAREQQDWQAVGPARTPTAERENQEKRDKTGDRGDVVQVEREETRDEMAQGAGETDIGRASDPEQAAQLADGDEDADGGGVTDDDGTGDELGDLTEAREPGGELDRAHQEADEQDFLQRGQRLGGEREQGAGEDDADGVGRADDEVPRRTKERAEDGADDGAGDHGGHGHADEQSEGDTLRNGDGGDGQAGPEIGPQEGAVVAVQ